MPSHTRSSVGTPAWRSSSLLCTAELSAMSRLPETSSVGGNFASSAGALAGITSGSRGSAPRK